jgi:hypothetical protein
MRAFMQDLEGTGQREKNGRVSMHWSSKGDGVFDRHSVFIDGLVLPRMILPMDGALLVAETDSNDLHLYRDTDNDGVADKKDLWFSGGPRGGNLEHQPSGLVWALDNWIYASYNAYRLRWNGPVRTAASGAWRRMTMANCGSPAAPSAGRRTSSSRFSTAASTSPGRRRMISPRSGRSSASPMSRAERCASEPKTRR